MDRSIQVRPFEPRHLDRIAAIERAAFAGEAWNRKLLSDYAKTCPELFLIARSGRRIAGYSITATSERSRSAELVSIAVDPRELRQGVGTALLDASRAQLKLRRIKTWWLMVAIENEPAARFYERYGFAKTRVVKGYYGAGRNAWRMKMAV